MVSKDQYLASISDPLGELHYPIRAPAEGVVIGMMRLPLVNQGDALVHLAHPKSGESRLDWLDGEDFREKWGLDPV
jgi:predicted deacylase